MHNSNKYSRLYIKWKRDTAVFTFARPTGYVRLSHLHMAGCLKIRTLCDHLKFQSSLGLKKRRQTT
jgi:hypothetical protein